MYSNCMYIVFMIKACKICNITGCMYVKIKYENESKIQIKIYALMNINFIFNILLYKIPGKNKKLICYF